jgi:hypothetical protein
MRRSLLTAVTLLALAACAWPRAAGAQTLLFDYVGFDFESPNPVPSTFGEFGSGYVGLGVVPGLFAPLVADTANYEYTYVISGLTPVGVVAIGTYLVIDYSPGTISLYEDSKASGTAADYGVNPPSALAPATFTDGSLFLTGTLSSFQFVVNSTNGTGSYEGIYDITGGSQLGNFPVTGRKGWTFAGSTGNANNIPPGYAHQIDGQNYLGLPVRSRATTWGRIKAEYR